MIIENVGKLFTIECCWDCERLFHVHCASFVEERVQKYVELFMSSACLSVRLSVLPFTSSWFKTRLTNCTTLTGTNFLWQRRTNESWGFWKSQTKTLLLQCSFTYMQVLCFTKTKTWGELDIWMTLSWQISTSCNSCWKCTAKKTNRQGDKSEMPEFLESVVDSGQPWQPWRGQKFELRRLIKSSEISDGSTKILVQFVSLKSGDPEPWRWRLLPSECWTVECSFCWHVRLHVRLFQPKHYNILF